MTFSTRMRLKVLPCENCGEEIVYDKEYVPGARRYRLWADTGEFHYCADEDVARWNREQYQLTLAALAEAPHEEQAEAPEGKERGPSW